MSAKARLDFILRLTDWFHGHWEDPEWGKLPTSQILISVAIRELASGIQDPELRDQMTQATDKAIAQNSRFVART